MSKNIGLIDVDGHSGFPNLALMKLSSWHKKQGDDVEWYDFSQHYDRVYMSKVFSFTPDYGYVINADEVVKGGTGYAIHGAGGEHYISDEDKPLPDEVEHIMPDYSLYGINDTAYGFLTRGCPRGCSFCIVGKKEGLCSRKVANLSEFFMGGVKNIVLNDPNILACKDWKDLLGQLAESKALVDFNQGLDARVLTEAKCLALDEVRIKEIRFAWDRYEDKNKVLPKLKMFAEICKKPHMHNAIVYVLVNHTSTLEQDLERIYTLMELGYWAYVMVYDKQHAPHIYTDLQRWCNNRFVFAKCPRFEDYGKIDKKKDERQQELFK